MYHDIPEPETFGDIHDIFRDGVFGTRSLTLDMKEPFFRLVAGEPGHRVAIFCSERMLDWHRRQLRDPEKVTIADGTFYSRPSSPRGVTQLYRVMTVHMGMVGE